MAQGSGLVTVETSVCLTSGTVMDRATAEMAVTKLDVLRRSARIPSSSVLLVPASASVWCVMGERTVWMVQMRVGSVPHQCAALGYVTTPATSPQLGRYVFVPQALSWRAMAKSVKM